MTTTNTTAKITGARARRTPKTAAERKAEQIERDARQGYRRLFVKVHDSHREKVRAFIRSLDAAPQ